MKHVSRDMRERTASEACLLLNEAFRELTALVRVFDLSQRWQNLKPPPEKAIAAVQNIVGRNVILSLYRLKETRDYFLKGWLFSENDLLEMGLAPVEQFFPNGAWKHFEILRNQYAGHSTSAKPRKKPQEMQQPPRIVPASTLGTAIRETGLINLENITCRIKREVTPGVIQVRDQIRSQYPKASLFVDRTYPSELQYALSVSAGE